MKTIQEVVLIELADGAKPIKRKTYSGNYTLDVILNLEGGEQATWTETFSLLRHAKARAAELPQIPKYVTRLETADYGTFLSTSYGLLSALSA